MADEQFVLRWHYHETTLMHNLPYLLESDILTDVTLSVGALHVRAHKIILAMCSVYFLQLFQEMRSVQHPVVVLHNVGIEDMRAVLSFIYRGQCVVSKDQLPSLLSVAKLLKIQGLCDMKVPEKQVQNYSTNEDDTLKLEPQEKEKSTNENNNNNSVNNDIQNKKRQEDDSTKKTIETCDTNALNIRNSGYSEKPIPDMMYKPEEPRFPSPPALKRQLSSNKDSSETCKCFLCGKYLSNQYNLRVHMETHEEAYHACQSCPHVSRSRDALRKHVSYRHPEECHTRKRKKTDNI